MQVKWHLVSRYAGSYCRCRVMRVVDGVVLCGSFVGVTLRGLSEVSRYAGFRWCVACLLCFLLMGGCVVLWWCRGCFCGHLRPLAGWGVGVYVGAFDRSTRWVSGV